MYDGYHLTNSRDISLDSITTLVHRSPNQTAKGKDEFNLNAELASLKRVRGQPPVSIPIDTWKRVQDDDTIQVQQYREEMCLWTSLQHIWKILGSSPMEFMQ
jgi:hypothetical protein